MGDYSPIHSGQSTTRTTSAAVTGGQLLIVSGDDTVAPSSAASGAWLGVAAFDAASGAKVTVELGGVQELTASGAIAAGAQVVAAADGKVATIGAGTFDQAVGVALNAAADGEPVRVRMER